MLLDKAPLARLAGIAAGIHFGRRFGLLGKTLSVYAGVLATHYLAEGIGPAKAPNGRPTAPAESANE